MAARGVWAVVVLMAACDRNGFGAAGSSTDSGPVADPCGGGDCALLRRDGTLTLLAGSPDVVGHADGAAATARFHTPGKIAGDGADLYVTELAAVTTRRLSGG